MARPSPVADATSLSCGIDFLQWMRAYRYEVLFAEMASHFILPTDQFPLQTPFRRSTIRNDISPGGDTMWCSVFESSSIVNMSSAQTDFNKWCDRNVADRRMKSIAFADFPNAYASI